MDWDKALAELLLEEPEIRSWLGLDPSPRDGSEPRQAAWPPAPPVQVSQPALAA